MSEFALVHRERPNCGFAIALPADWLEEPPNLGNSPHEVARYFHRGAVSRGLVVFRDMSRASLSPQAWAAEMADVLRVSGAANLVASETRVGSGAGARLDFTMKQIGRPDWCVRELFAVADGGYCFMLGTESPHDDAELFSAVQETIELFSPKATTTLPASAFANWYPRPLRAFALARELSDGEGNPLSEAHILMGLVSVGEGVAFEILSGLGATRGRLRDAFRDRPAVPASNVSPNEVTPSAYGVVATAVHQHAATLGHNYIGTEHLLLGLITSDGDVDGAWDLLGQVGVQRQDVRDRLADHFERVIERLVRGIVSG